MSSFHLLTYLETNIVWMLWNIMLASVPVLIANKILSIKSFPFRLAGLLLWLLFLPNTLYLITDGMYVLRDPSFFHMNPISLIVGVFLYATLMALGIFTFFYALKYVHLAFSKSLCKMSLLQIRVLMISLHALVGIGMGMGRFARTNSWYVLTQPIRVVEDVIFTLSHTEVLFFSAGFGMFSFLLHTIFKRYFYNDLRYSS